MTKFDCVRNARSLAGFRWSIAPHPGLLEFAYSHQHQVRGCKTEGVGWAIAPEPDLLELGFPVSSFADASLKELAGRLPQSLTSLSLDIFCCMSADGLLQELARRLPQSLTSLSLDFRNSFFKGSSLKGLAGRLPQSLTSLRLDVSGCRFTSLRSLLVACRTSAMTQTTDRWCIPCPDQQLNISRQHQ